MHLFVDTFMMDEYVHTFRIIQCVNLYVLLLVYYGREKIALLFTKRNESCFVY